MTILEFKKKDSGQEKYEGTFSVYRKPDGRIAVYGEGNGSEPSNAHLCDLLRDALWAYADDPIAIVLLEDEKAYVDVGDDEEIREESWGSLIETLLKAYKEEFGQEFVSDAT